ncbi:MAG: YggS family pyridoxal phosphate-dependent enzyme [Burkholderiales bacterium]
MTTITARLQAVKARIEAAALAAGRRPSDVGLLAVSKSFSDKDIMEAYRAGQQVFGENFVQEGVEKVACLAGLSIEWSFIGPVQSNKTRLVAENFDWVHSVDRLKIAERLAHARPESRPPLQICIQVNVSQEASKSGVAPDETLVLSQKVAGLSGLSLRGLMAIPEPTSDVASQRRQFRMLREIRDEIVRHGIVLDTLSMGMSDDLEAAIAEGSTLVRVGRAIFGPRSV